MAVTRHATSRQSRTDAVAKGKLIDISKLAGESGLPLFTFMTVDLHNHIIKESADDYLFQLLGIFALLFLFAFVEDPVDRINHRFCETDIVMYIVAGDVDEDCVFVFDRVRKPRSVRTPSGGCSGRGRPRCRC